MKCKNSGYYLQEHPVSKANRSTSEGESTREQYRTVGSISCLTNKTDK